MVADWNDDTGPVDLVLAETALRVLQQQPFIEILELF
jgi:hypothetical protein